MTSPAAPRSLTGTNPRSPAPLPVPAPGGGQRVRVLCCYPLFPETYWGAEYSLRLTGRRSMLPPLGLLTVAALLPPSWEVRLADLNLGPLDPSLLDWAEVVFVSGMLVQRESLLEVARAARARGKRVVAGGAYASTNPDALAPEVDCVVVGEAEGVMAELVAAVEGGAPLPPRLQATGYPDLRETPVPRYELLERGAYQSMGVQWSRGCPFNCEFCDIIEIFGRVVRTKTPPQLLAELDAIHATGFRGSLFLVDDNFIGNKAQARLLLPPLEAWMRAHGDPFDLYTEASLNLATDVKLLDAMVAAGFGSVFVGIETPSVEALRHSGKLQNTGINVAEAVQTLTSHGLEVMAGFILGFDTDDAAAIERQREWISASAVPLAMVGLLMALPGTQLERRLQKEGRLLHDSGGDNFVRTNFVTRLEEGALLEGFARLLAEVYSPAGFYRRALRVLALSPRDHSRFRQPGLFGVLCLLRSAWRMGVLGKHRAAYWRFLAQALRVAPTRLAKAVAFTIHAEHMVRYTEETVLPRLAASVLEARRGPRSAGVPAAPSPRRGVKVPERHDAASLS
jgi:radical SAM superfamily enzyme YgiQ (UPF0313 family)